MPVTVTPVLPMHETWFEHTDVGRDWGFYFSPLPLALTAAMVLVTVAWRLAAVRFRTPELRVLEPIGRLTPWVPRLLGIHLGVSLLALAATGAFLTPAVDDLGSGAGQALLLLEAALGVWLITGFRIRAAAGLTLALGPVLALVSGPVALAECANLAAVAAFLVIVPPAADRYEAADPSPAALAWGLLAMRLGVGAALISLAFTEKFTHPALAAQTLHDYPALNVFDLAGLPMPTHTFIAVAGSVELLFGLLVISGAAPQVAVLVAAVPFNATLILFGQTELVGHLPVYGVFLALLAYGSNPATAAAVPWLPRRDDLRRMHAAGSAPASVRASARA